MHSLMQAIAEESHSESKWKQLGELAMSAGQVQVCFDGSINIAHDLLEVYKSNVNFPFVGMSVLQLDVAEECLRHAKDLSGLLLLYSAVGNAKGLESLSVSAQENGKSNVAFISLFLLGKVEDCVELLIAR